MTTESLIVELDARTAKLDTKIEKTNQVFDSLEEKVNQADTALDTMGATSVVAAKKVKQLDSKLEKTENTSKNVTKTTKKTGRAVKELGDESVDTSKNIEKLETEMSGAALKAKRLTSLSGFLAKSIKKTGDESEDSRLDLKKLGGVAKGVGSVILKTGAAALTLSGALTAMVLGSGKGRKELETMARMANDTEENFKSLSFATSQYGIDANKIADITKDISDRLGEFATAGTGVFQDYGDVMSLTKEQTRAAAIEFQKLSGEDVIKRVVSDMESVNATGAQMTFVLESMGNDLSKLKPLFADNSAELTKLKERFTLVNESMSITQHQADGLKEVSTTFNLMTSSFGNASTAISATLAPVMDDFFNDVIAIVPEATQTIIDFVNSFLDAENIQSVAAANKRVEDSVKDLAEAEKELEGLIAKRIRTAGKFDEQGFSRKAKENEIAAEKKLLAELRERLAVLQNIEKLEDAKTKEGGEIGGEAGGETGTKLAPLVMADDEQKKLEALKKFSMARAEILDAQLIEDMNRLDLAAETFSLKDEELVARRLEIVRGHAEKKAALEAEGVKEFKEGKDEEVKVNKLSDLQKLNQTQSGIRAGMALNNLLFEDNKAIAAGLIVADTATAIMASLKINPLGWGNVAAIGVAGAAQFASALSATKGGGSMSAPSGPSFAEQQTSFVDQGATITDISGDNQTTETVVFEFSDEAVDVLSRHVQKSQSDRRT